MALLFYLWSSGQYQCRTSGSNVYVVYTIHFRNSEVSSLVGKEYSLADFRWGVADSTIVSLEMLTVLGAGPICLYIVYQIIKRDPARHYWIVVLSTAELYGGWMTFCPDWLIGSPNLNTSNWLHLWVYLFVRLSHNKS